MSLSWGHRLGSQGSEVSSKPRASLRTPRGERAEGPGQTTRAAVLAKAQGSGGLWLLRGLHLLGAPRGYFTVTVTVVAFAQAPL